MTDIKTLVYFDLEATGLKCFGRPRITELSFVAVNIQDLPYLHTMILNHLKVNKPGDKVFQMESLLPRVLNKLTLCVYPMATVMPDVASITKLDNYNLSGQAKFDKNTGEMLNIFLTRLPSPVCIVAHNGDLYDFPLFKAELEKAGTKLESQILCVDSYLGLREIFKKREKASLVEDAKINFSRPPSFSLINLHEHLLGSPPRISHGSEADCFALLRITAVIGKDWLDWVKNNCYCFTKCREMWLMDNLGELQE
jgi:DNA polymerase III epsilon subunit-like protein